jgi:hypothetical protein
MKIAGTSTDVRARLAWSGAITGNSFDQGGGWGNTWYEFSPTTSLNYTSKSVTFTLALPAGTTYFNLEAYKTGSPTQCNLAYVTVNVTPIQWADAYAVGVS